MFNLIETSIEWALKHLCQYCDSDCFPRIREFQAFKSNWSEVREHILSIDLDEYVPKSPVILLAPKPNGLYRVVQRLSPIDSIIYTALAYEIHEAVENYRIPSSEGIACSYRIKPDVDGAFFDKDDTGWERFTERTKTLAEKYPDGFVLVTDITDFYNQIYAHRVRGVVAEAGAGALDAHAQVIEKFLMGLYTKTSRGIPIGPAASIVVSEAILGDIDKKLLSYTRDFVRWVDDARIFFNTRADAQRVLYELTDYLYRSHRLVFSGEKTTIVPTSTFMDSLYVDEKLEEHGVLARTAEEMALSIVIADALEASSSYSDSEAIIEAAASDLDRIDEEIVALPEFAVTSAAYVEWLANEFSKSTLDFTVLRRLYRRAMALRIRSILELTLDNFEALLPIVREVAIYLHKVLNEAAVTVHKETLYEIWNSDYSVIPYVNNWLCYVLEKPCFEVIGLPTDYERICGIRNCALIAHRKGDITWVKSHRDGIDTLGDWEKRGVLLASSILSRDEMRHLLDAEAGRGGITEQAIAQYLKSSST